MNHAHDQNTQEQNVEPSIDEQTVSASVQAEVDEWKQKYLRILADYQNLERRTKEEKELIRAFSSELTIKQLLPAFDGLERAAEHIKDNGLRLSLKEFYTILESIGVKKIKTVGEVFDPYKMECVDVAEGEDGVVLEELAPGYVLHDKVLRVAKVTVGKK